MSDISKNKKNDSQIFGSYNFTFNRSRKILLYVLYFTINMIQLDSPTDRAMWKYMFRFAD